MYQISEYQSFTQGGNPYKKMKLGDHGRYPKSFENLNDQQKEWAKENITQRMEQSSIPPEVIIEDDFLLEPPYEEIIARFGEKFYEDIMHDKPIIGNNHNNFYFDIHYPNKHINLEKAAIINNDEYFLRWLGISDSLAKDVYYTILEDSIEFEENDVSYNFNESDLEELDIAKKKFEDHCIWVLDSIEKGFEYFLSEEGIMDEIEAHDEWKFDEDGVLIESVNEFKQGGNPYTKMGVGNRARLERWMKDNDPEVKYKINKNGELELRWWNIIHDKSFEDLPDYVNINFVMYDSEYNFDSLDFDYVKKHSDVDNMEQGSYEKLIIELFYLREIYQQKNTLKLENKLIEMLEEFGTKVLNDDILYKVFKHDNQNIILLGKKLFRGEHQEMVDELFNTYIFIGYDEFKEITIDGEDYHKKILGIENLFKIDMYDSASLMNVEGMKMRAHTIPDSNIYVVKIPKYLGKKDSYYNDDINDKLRKYIDENKSKL